MVFNTKSALQTVRLGERIGRSLIPGDVVALVGDLGAGKTTLVSGLAKGLGVPESYQVTSPTFVKMHLYPGRCPVYHLDFYRVRTLQEVVQLGILETMGFDSVFIIEWYEKFPRLWSGDTIHIDMRAIEDQTRILEIREEGERAEALLRLLERNDP